MAIKYSIYIYISYTINDELKKKHSTKHSLISLTLPALRIIGPSYGGVWMCIAGVWDLQTTGFGIP